jgi:acyl transferase domain-containing protein
MEKAPQSQTNPLPWVLAGADDEDLRARARALRDQVDATPPQGLARLAAATAAQAAPLRQRAVAFAGDQVGALRELDDLARDSPGAATIRGEALADARVAFVFPPLRCEYKGMTLGLGDRHPVFAERLATCEEALEPLVGWSLADILNGRDGTPAFERLDVSQPVLFAACTALAELWGAYGVRPRAVLGHSVGEIAAAATCGALSLVDAAQVAATWGRSSMRLEGTGAMASLSIPAAEAERRLERWRGRLTISGRNSPTWTAVSGEVEAVEALLAELAAEGLAGRSMGIDGPGHSAGMAPIDAWFRDELATISPRPTTIGFWSAVEAGPVDPSELDAAYWSRNLRQPVLFEAALRSLHADGCNAFIEIGPRPILTGAIEEILSGEPEVAAIGSWEQGEANLFHLQLAEAYVRGVEVDWLPLCREPKKVTIGDGREEVSPAPTATLREQLLAAPPAARAQLALEAVRRELSEILGEVAAPGAGAKSFRDLGLNSRGALALRSGLNRATGLALPATLVFDYPTPRAVATKILLDLEGSGEAAATPTTPAEPAPDAAEERALRDIDGLNLAGLIERGLGAAETEPAARE